MVAAHFSFITISWRSLVEQFERVGDWRRPFGVADDKHSRLATAAVIYCLTPATCVRPSIRRSNSFVCL